MEDNKILLGKVGEWIWYKFYFDKGNNCFIEEKYHEEYLDTGTVFEGSRTVTAQYVYKTFAENMNTDGITKLLDAIYDEDHSLVEVVKFEGFGSWIESVSTIKKIFLLMQPLINALTVDGYSIIEIGTFGGVYELGTGYECFSDKRYASFEEAKEKLPLDFAEEKRTKLDGSWLTTLNFETFSIKLIKNNVCYEVLFSGGELLASSVIADLIPVDEMKTALIKNK